MIPPLILNAALIAGNIVLATMWAKRRRWGWVIINGVAALWGVAVVLLN
jgi:hypothetical protein